MDLRQNLGWMEVIHNISWSCQKGRKANSLIKVKGHFVGNLFEKLLNMFEASALPTPIDWFHMAKISL